MTFTLFPAIGETRMADGQQPKDGGDHDADDGEDTEDGQAVEDGIEEEPAPLLAGEEIHRWEKENAEIDHIVVGK